MEEIVPDDVTCTFINDDNLSLEKDGVEKVVGYNDGRIVELCGNTVVAACYTSLSNPSEISVFYSYDPFKKYYVVREDLSSAIIVLRKSENDLEVFKTYKNVQKYEINDFLIVGRPQVKIWFHDEMEPIITDFTDNNLNNLSSSQETLLSINLSNKLHLMKSSLKEMSSISEERKLIRKKHLKQLCSEENLLILCDTPWQRIFNDCLIICVPVKNGYDDIVNHIELLISNNGVNIIETKVFSAFCSTTDEYYPIKEITPSLNAYVIGVVNELNFINMEENVTLSCSLLYNVSNYGNLKLKKLEIPPFQLNIEHLINGNLGLFNSDINDLIIQDIITVISMSEAILLEIHLDCSQITADLTDVLVKNLHFVKVQFVKDENLCCYIVKPQSCSILSGLLLFINKICSPVISFKCYPKNLKQITILKSYLKKIYKDLIHILQKEIETCKEENPILAAVNTLDDEFKHFISVMKCTIPPLALPVKENDKLKFTADVWRELLKSNLQFKTDSKFQEALECRTRNTT